MTEIARGIVKRKVDIFQSFTHPLGLGAIATDGVQYSVAGTVGTTAVTVFTELIDPGVDLSIKKLQVGLTFKTTHLGSAAGSLMFYWQMRTEGWHDPVGTLRNSSYVTITGATLGGPVGSAVNNTYEHTVSGYVPVGSVPATPIRLNLIAEMTANWFTVQMKNSSFVKMVGVVIPGA